MQASCHEQRRVVKVFKNENTSSTHNVQEENESDERELRSEADLRGSLNNDSLSENERTQIEEERAKAQEAANLRKEDFQLAYAIDLLKGLSAINSSQ